MAIAVIKLILWILLAFALAIRFTCRTNNDEGI
jgi:hypothetical protein